MKKQQPNQRKASPRPKQNRQLKLTRKVTEDVTDANQHKEITDNNVPSNQLEEFIPATDEEVKINEEEPAVSDDQTEKPQASKPVRKARVKNEPAAAMKKRVYKSKAESKTKPSQEEKGRKKKEKDNVLVHTFDFSRKDNAVDVCDDLSDNLTEDTNQIKEDSLSEEDRQEETETATLTDKQVEPESTDFKIPSNSKNSQVSKPLKKNQKKKGVDEESKPIPLHSSEDTKKTKANGKQNIDKQRSTDLKSGRGRKKENQVDSTSESHVEDKENLDLNKVTIDEAPPPSQKGSVKPAKGKTASKENMKEGSEPVTKTMPVRKVSRKASAKQQK